MSFARKKTESASSSAVSTMSNVVSDHVIRLNVGGKRFEISMQTVAKYPNALLARMFSAENSSLLRKDAEGFVFFDRSAKLFEHVLTFYRTGNTVRFNNASKQAILQEEFLFWGFDLQAFDKEASELAKDEQKKSNAEACKRLESFLNASAPAGGGTDKFFADLVGESAYDFLEVLLVFRKFVDQFSITVTTEGGFKALCLDVNKIAVLTFLLPLDCFYRFHVSATPMIIGLYCDFISSMEKNGLRKLLSEAAEAGERLPLAVRIIVGAQDDVIVSIYRFANEENGTTSSICSSAFRTRNWDLTQETIEIPPSSWPIMFTLKTRILQKALEELQNSCSKKKFEKYGGKSLVFQSDSLCERVQIALQYDATDTVHCTQSRMISWKTETERSTNSMVGTPTDVKIAVDCRHCFTWFKNLPASSTTTTIYLKNQFPIMFESNLGAAGTVRFILSPRSSFE